MKKIAMILSSVSLITLSGNVYSQDWWPMFRHDLNHTGYSTSTAPSTNDVLWSYTTSDNVRSSPAVADGKVYVESWDDNIFCLDASNGDFIWSYTTDWYVFSSPAVADDKVYVGSYDGNVYCFGSSAEPIPTLSEWGMIILGLLLLAVGTACKRRSKSVPSGGRKMYHSVVNNSPYK